MYPVYDLLLLLLRPQLLFSSTGGGSEKTKHLIPKLGLRLKRLLPLYIRSTFGLPARRDAPPRALRCSRSSSRLASSSRFRFLACSFLRSSLMLKPTSLMLVLILSCGWRGWRGGGGGGVDGSKGGGEEWWRGRGAEGWMGVWVYGSEGAVLS